MCCLFAATKTLRIPKVFHVGPMPNGRGSFIVMEALKMSGSCSMSELGRQLARMHLAEPAVSFKGVLMLGYRGASCTQLQLLLLGGSTPVSKSRIVHVAEPA
jgi:fructosamine-3-kinase